MQTPGNFFLLLQKTKVIYIFYNIKKFPLPLLKKKQNDITLTLVVLGVLFRLKFALNGFVRYSSSSS